MLPAVQEKINAYMRKLLLAFGLFALATVSFSSCASNRDCNGVKHTTLSNGVRI